MKSTCEMNKRVCEHNKSHLDSLALTSPCRQVLVAETVVISSAIFGVGSFQTAVCLFVCLSVCLYVRTITQKVWVIFMREILVPT